jgi:hypothetical protein
MENLTAIDKLADLLHDHAKPVVRPQRLAPSPIYDLDYRMTIIALAISIHGKTEADGSLRIESARLKLVQFVAQHFNDGRALVTDQTSYLVLPSVFVEATRETARTTKLCSSWWRTAFCVGIGNI